jgi:hypothetical protein
MSWAFVCFAAVEALTEQSTAPDLSSLVLVAIPAIAVAVSFACPWFLRARGNAGPALAIAIISPSLCWILIGVFVSSMVQIVGGSMYQIRH